ncbi:hypothetical protein LRH25_27300 [Ideonella azotifigens]|uniref:Peptidase M15C domain-containing protein n=1 Tax=Ideonella azotifigens TaxID=513160 RepID=A0ABP3VJC3_9BURK|nr:hypothetical protein [Ideonella azotifigens]MCD2344035.1 hypothetical protein [Ideonella azotifigens]
MNFVGSIGHEDGIAPERTFAYGVCVGCPEQKEMSDLLARHGLGVSKGAYKIIVSDCECFSFEDWRPEGEWTLDGTAARPEVLNADARQVSGALMKAQIRHWLGIYDGDQNQMDYLHFDWPDQDPQQS